ncbi:MAG: bifunctional adenosylcobinamide kinase/adenosylcobinamide-phosphate guanylyltransferase [Desulfovibrionaceae bacterium]|nr:bifunctional adenosylcobinamide kinase/adenosylcobinamide-phosphate guanylyltransferase [Desulfovibrionaceae bacterium]
MRDSILFVGGTRSGKSALAQKWAEAVGTKRLFIATLRVRDWEMQKRVQKHQEERGANWALCEIDHNLEQRVEEIVTQADPPQVLLLDCVSTWITNLLEDGCQEDTIYTQVRSFARIVAAAHVACGVVTTEVGLGVVPMTPLGRQFRDVLGQANQILAASMPNVVLVSCGLPLVLKGYFCAP